MNKELAQRRADRIQAFRDELLALETEGFVSLTADQKGALRARHDAILRDLSSRFDVDTTEELKQMSWGMRIASFLGAVALSAAVFFFFQRIWGSLSTEVRVLILIGGPLLGVAATEIAARVEKTLYFASLLAILSFACFVLDLDRLGAIFNITPTQNALLVWAAFAFILAYTYGLRLLVVAGIVSFMGYLSATMGTWGGCYWLSFGERPENFLLAGLVIFALGAFAPHRVHAGFPAYYRLFGLLAVVIPILVLSNWGETSYLRLEASAVEILYQLVGFLVSGLCLWIGIRMGWTGVTNLGGTFFVILLYTKFYDWWWKLMPKYLFFLVMGLIAVGLLLVLKKVRGLSRTEPA